MRSIPEGCLGSKFLRRYPMSQQMIAGSEAATLEYIVQYQQYGHDHDHRIDKVRSGLVSGNQTAQSVAPSEDQIQDDAYSETQRKMPSRVRTVRNDAVYEL